MTVTRYRKRPVEVDTVQWTGDNEAAVQAFTDGASNFYALDPEDRENSDDPEATATVFDKLHSTWVLVYTGQHIVRGVKGEYYPIAEDVLAETYEPVAAEPDHGVSEPQRADAIDLADTCRPVVVDGQTILMRGSGNLTGQEQQFATEIVRAAKRKFEAEHAEPEAKQLRALAFNAVGTALQARGEWLRLTSRQAVADAVLDVVLPLARTTAELGRMSAADVQRVIDLYERWCAAGPPPLGTSVSRWWDRRLVELHDAILPPEQPPGTDQTKEQ